jgi:hypothetical protein
VDPLAATHCHHPISQSHFHRVQVPKDLLNEEQLIDNLASYVLHQSAIASESSRRLFLLLGELLHHPCPILIFVLWQDPDSFSIV